MERVAHLRPFRLPGGEAAIREGWRAAESLLFALERPALNNTVRRMLERNVNAPPTTSVGRLFDAVAALTGIARESRFEGEAAMKLERAASGTAPTNSPMATGARSSRQSWQSPIRTWPPHVSTVRLPVGSSRPHVKRACAT